MAVKFVNRSVLVSLILLAISAACAPQSGAPGGSAPSASTAPASSGSDWDRILAEARREGEVIVWVGPGADARRLNKDRFEEAYPGIRVELAQIESSERDARFVREFQAGVAKVDVMTTG